MRPSNTVVFCAIDEFVPFPGKPLTGFPEFLHGLAQAGIPCVWVTLRNRHQLDSSLRKLGHSAPFIGEGGSAVYLPEDYFHLKPELTVRLGRFTCIPVAEPQPAAAEALETLAEEVGTSVVPLRSLSPRELSQNTGLPRREAEALRQGDFDELFFFAGASDLVIRKFLQKAQHYKVSIRSRGALWSLAVHPSLVICVQELRKLYNRALHSHAFALAVATMADSAELGKACDRSIFLVDRAPERELASPADRPTPKTIRLFSADTWELVLESILNRRF